MRRDACDLRGLGVVGRGLVVLGRGLGNLCATTRTRGKVCTLLKSTRFWAGVRTVRRDATGCGGRAEARLQLRCDVPSSSSSSSGAWARSRPSRPHSSSSSSSSASRRPSWRRQACRRSVLTSHLRRGEEKVRVHGAIIESLQTWRPWKTCDVRRR